MNTTSTADITDSHYLWHFIGDDPYDIRMANKDMNDRKATTDPGEWLVRQNATIKDKWYRQIDGYHKDDGASMVMLRYDADHYNLAIISDATATDYQYLYYFGGNGQNNANCYFMRSEKADSPLYVSDRLGCQLSFSSVDADFTFHIVDTNGRVAITHTATGQPVGTPLTDYMDIPEAIRSPYLEGEALTFYSFSGTYDQSHLTDENQITETPLNSADIYVTYTTDHLAEKFLHLRGARVFNITVDGNYVFDDSGTLSHEATDANNADESHLWSLKGGDPYAVQIENADAKRLLGYDTSDGTLALAANPTNKYFVLMEGSATGDGTTYAQMELMAATGDDTYYRVGRTSELNVSTTAGHAASLQVCTYVTTSSVTYHLIDKDYKLIESIAASSSELALPTEWTSPLVSAYHFYTTSGYDSEADTYTPTDEVFTLIDAGSDIYVTYDVNSMVT